MPYSLQHNVQLYLYDVFIGRFDLWVAFGLVAQMLFAGRFLVQWIESERAGRSVIPVSFWILSILGGGMTLIYGFVRHDAIIIIGQVLSNLIYVRNLVLISKSRQQTKTDG
ncbi:MAG: lipid-A-disaccharide synthase N-terminal domain-containing protein [Janthinobacterium lividum]